MRYIYSLVFVLCFAPLSAAESHVAVITTEGAAVRSGPGIEFYPTLHLRAGDKVEVFYEQGDWRAIRPPIGSFSWVSARFVQFGSGNIGTVLADGLASRIGSDYSDDSETVQVTLKRGEPVFILDRRETPENPASPLWLKIAPPSGEFRWIHRSALSSRELLLNNESRAMPLTPRAPIQQVQHTAAPALPRIAAAHSSGAMQDAIVVIPSSTNISTTNTTSPNTTALNTTTASTTTVDPFQRAFQELQREAYIVMTRPTDDDVFAVLIQRAYELHRIAPTDHALEKTYHLLESLQRTRAVRREIALRRPATAGIMRSAAPQQPVSQAFTLTSAQDTPPLRAGVNVGGFDIVGRLGEFYPLPPGHPPYAIVDENGRILCLISPLPNLVLSQHIGQIVGINGILGEYRQEGRPPARHITARDIRTLQ